MMAYHLHRLRCWLALARAAWSQAGAEGHHAEWQMERTVARKRSARAEELRRQLVEMRRVRM